MLRDRYEPMNLFDLVPALGPAMEPVLTPLIPQAPPQVTAIELALTQEEDLPSRGHPFGDRPGQRDMLAPAGMAFLALGHEPGQGQGPLAKPATPDQRQTAGSHGAGVRHESARPLGQAGEHWAGKGQGERSAREALLSPPARKALDSALPLPGAEFIAGQVKAWLEANGASAHYLEAGCPWQDGYQESSRGELRDELRDRAVFVWVAQARVGLESHRHWYNGECPHSGLKFQTPAAFRRAWQEQREGPPGHRQPDFARGPKNGGKVN